MTGIPRSELFHLALTAAEAEDQAAAGEVEAGLRCLEAGLARANHELRAEGWAPDLRCRYEKAVERYRRRYTDYARCRVA